MKRGEFNLTIGEVNYLVEYTIFPDDEIDYDCRLPSGRRVPRATFSHSERQAIRMAAVEHCALREADRQEPPPELYQP